MQRWFKPPAIIKAVNDVSLHVMPGESVAIVGESGCGKSTLGRMLMRLMKPTCGEISLDGVDLTALPDSQMRQHRNKIQLVFQDPYGSLNPLMTVGQILREPVVLHKIVPRDRADARVREVLELVGLKPDHYFSYPHQFSGGQRQRVAIGRALAAEPLLVVCDEPVSALDVSVRAQILNLLKDIQRETNVANLFISHDLSAVRYVADRILVMYLGRIVEEGPCEQIFENPRHPYTRALLAAVPNAGRGKSQPLKGDIPTPLNLPPGCNFHQRCPHAEPMCKTQRPELVDDGTGHATACHLWQRQPAWQSGQPGARMANPGLQRLIQAFSEKSNSKKAEATA